MSSSQKNKPISLNVHYFCEYSWQSFRLAVFPSEIGHDGLYDFKYDNGSLFKTTGGFKPRLILIFSSYIM